ncbi:MAG: large ribosomal subunit protein uL22 [Elusimicrobiales bacterium]|jgi:large subunit ribosomal protein L22|nr:uL22 family ribosomal protein [Elusimicrobiales bacterium]HOL61864.1 uL22 family ribosomal protein [Elusimicrobiales bacterium]HPO95082.1 uL22 family ribosomal protein [Elusimicrobiales bacterium]
MEAICKLKYQRHSQLKVRRIANLIKGKNLWEATHFLNSLTTPTKTVVLKAIKSAGANLSNKLAKKVDLKDVWIKEIAVDQGPMKFLRRYNAGPMGRGMPYTRNMCHIKVVVSDLKN